MIKSRLKILLAENDTNQLRLSKKINVRVATLNALSNNKLKHIPIDILNGICKELNCQISDIIQYVPDEDNE